MAKTLQIQSDRFHRMWTLLRWSGSLRNNEIQQMFSLSATQASRLIADFREAYPGKLCPEPGTKNWIPNDLADADSLGGPLDEFIVSQERHATERPTWYEDARADFLVPTSDKFRLIQQCCEYGTGLSMMYSSLTQGPRERLIYPHAIVRMPQRWHVRAWCAARREYRDFNFGRMDGLKLDDSPRPDMPGDEDWNRFVSLRIKPHRDLNSQQFATVQLELCSGAMARRVNVRGALVPYLVNQLRIAVNPAEQHPPDFLLELINKDLDKYLFKESKRG